MKHRQTIRKLQCVCVCQITNSTAVLVYVLDSIPLQQTKKKQTKRKNNATTTTKTQEPTNTDLATHTLASVARCIALFAVLFFFPHIYLLRSLDLYVLICDQVSQICVLVFQPQLIYELIHTHTHARSYTSTQMPDRSFSRNKIRFGKYESESDFALKPKTFQPTFDWIFA